MASQPLPFKSPGSTRKALKSSELTRAVSQPTLSGSTVALPQTPAASQRRKSTKERTPRQVTALLSARKQASARKSSGASQASNASTEGVLGLLRGDGGGLDTPGGLLRALSRMPDLPPPTPSEAPISPVLGAEDESLQPEPDHRPRDSILGGRLPSSESRSRSSRSPSGSQESSSDVLPPPQPTRVRATTPRTSFFHTCMASGLGARTPPPPGSGLAGMTEEQLTESARRRRATSSGGEVAASLLGESYSQSRRHGEAEDRDVEQGRRVSAAPSAFTSPGRRLSEFGVEGSDEDRARDKPRFSAVSLESGYGGEESRGRPSLALSAISGAESVSPDFEQDVSYALEAAANGDEGQDDAFSEATQSQPQQEGREHPGQLPAQDEDDEALLYGDGQKFDLGEEIDAAYPSDDEDTQAEVGLMDVEELGNEDRIPWEAKGKGRASVEGEQDEYDMGGFELQDKGASDSDADDDDEDAESVAAGLTGSQRSSLPPLPRLPSLPPLPAAPLLARAEAARKARVLAEAGARASSNKSKKRKRTQRYTPSGEAVPDLPTARQKALLQHFLGPNVKVEEGAMSELEDASQEFFAQLMGDVGAFAQHAGRKKMVNEQDLVLWMHRQRILTPKNRLQTHGRRLGLDRELQSVLDAIVDNDESAGALKKSLKRSRKTVDATARKKVRAAEIESESEAEEVSSQEAE